MVENEQIILTFFANSYDDAMAIRNKFLNFEPHIPMSKCVIAERILTMTNTINNENSTIRVVIFRPIKTEQDWQCDYQI